MNASNKMAIKVRKFIKKTLDGFSRDLSYLSNLRYELSVVCTHCQQRESDLDGLMSCCHDDRLHLLRVRPGEELICIENFSDETVKVPGWEMDVVRRIPFSGEQDFLFKCWDNELQLVLSSRLGVKKWRGRCLKRKASRKPRRERTATRETMEPQEDTQIADGASSELKTTGQGVERKKRKRKKNFTGLDESISQDDVLLIAHELGSLWKMVGRALNVPKAVIDEIEADESKVSEKCYTLLTSWKERYSKDATYHHLAGALKNPAVGRADLAEKYCGL